jgi:hypothetical protein
MNKTGKKQLVHDRNNSEFPIQQPCPDELVTWQDTLWWMHDNPPESLHIKASFSLGQRQWLLITGLNLEALNGSKTHLTLNSY